MTRIVSAILLDWCRGWFPMRTPSIYSCRRSFLSCSIRSWTLPDQADLTSFSESILWMCSIVWSRLMTMRWRLSLCRLRLFLCAFVSWRRAMMWRRLVQLTSRLLLNQKGLNYVCHTAERFYAVARVLAKMVDVLLEAPSGRVFHQVICCYIRLSGHPTAREVLK